MSLWVNVSTVRAGAQSAFTTAFVSGQAGHRVDLEGESYGLCWPGNTQLLQNSQSPPLRIDNPGHTGTGDTFLEPRAPSWNSLILWFGSCYITVDPHLWNVSCSASSFDLKLGGLLGCVLTQGLQLSAEHVHGGSLLASHMQSVPNQTQQVPHQAQPYPPL